ncbi:MAG: DUF6537 domain-containing protein [Minwuia sp.]|uniref:DUF6537 domain-containing protein n=1 Tax=Minwuia sp. TaxID=2493630 RepID=UPI003A89B4BD
MAALPWSSNLKGFEAGFALAQMEGDEEAPEPSPVSLESGALAERIEKELPEKAKDLARQGVVRLTDYQGPGYARLYLDRLAKVAEADARHGGPTNGFDVTVETARRLALWMAFEDLIRVADLKTRPERIARVREEVRAADGQIVTVTEFMKPGIDEWTSLMPRWIGRPVLGLADRMGLRHRMNVGLHVNTTSVGGFVPLWLMSKLKGWRPRTMRYADEQARIEAWLKAILRSVEIDRGVALMVARSAKIVRGYSDTHARGVAKHAKLMSRLDDCLAAPEPAAVFRPLLDAAISDPEGDSLERLIGKKEAA